MEIAVTAAAGQAVYGWIPTDPLRGFFDNSFPWFAKCPHADILPFKDFHHRWAEGHDLLLDVPSTFTQHGVVDGVRHTGHVVLTDFPTKAGIPIPGFSESGLGALLAEAGISKGWLCVNVMDTGIGILAVAEGSADLSAALAGNLDMSAATFFDTFVEGGVEVVISTATLNPLLLAGGVENILAGMVSTWKTYTMQVDPLDFFGGALGTAALGALLTLALGSWESTEEAVRETSLNALRGASLGALFSVETMFGVGALFGFAAIHLGKALAESSTARKQALLGINREGFELLLRTFEKGNPGFRKFWKEAQPRMTLLDEPKLLPSQCKLRLPSDWRPFPWEFNCLPSDAPIFDTSYESLPSDAPTFDSSFDPLGKERNDRTD